MKLSELVKVAQSSLEAFGDSEITISIDTDRAEFNNSVLFTNEVVLSTDIGETTAFTISNFYR